MAQRGPKPTPTKILQLRGSWRGKSRPQEPTPQAEKPPCPKWLSPEERKLWKQVTGELLTLGIVARVDAGALTRYVCMRLQWQRLQAYIADHGETMAVMKQRWVEACTDDEGHLIASHHELVAMGEALRPQTTLLLQIADRLLRIEESFGMTPAARASIGIEVSKARAAMPKPTHPLTGNPRRFLHLGDPG